DIAVALCAVIGCDLGGVLNPADLCPDSAQRIALALRRRGHAQRPLPMGRLEQRGSKSEDEQEPTEFSVLLTGVFHISDWGRAVGARGAAAVLAIHPPADPVFARHASRPHGLSESTSWPFRSRLLRGRLPIPRGGFASR